MKHVQSRYFAYLNLLPFCRFRRRRRRRRRRLSSQVPKLRGLHKNNDRARSVRLLFLRRSFRGARTLSDLMHLSIVLELVGHYCSH